LRPCRIAAAAAIAVPVLAGGDKVAFPADYGKGVVYMTLDRPRTSRSASITPARPRSTRQERRGAPQGTVITVVQYAAQLDAQGTRPRTQRPLRQTATSRLHRDGEARRLGRQYPGQRNGEWNTRPSAPTRRTTPTQLTLLQLHKPQSTQDSVFSYEKPRWRQVGAAGAEQTRAGLACIAASHIHQHGSIRLGRYGQCRSNRLHAHWFVETPALYQASTIPDSL